MAKYTMKDFISGKIAVHTGLDSQKFLELCDKHDLKWRHGDKATAWLPKRYGEDTCIVCECGTLMHGFVRLFGTPLAKHLVVKPEDVAEMNQPSHYRIVIDCMDNKVTKAHMYVGTKKVKTAIARRNPVDEFDFAIGAKVAFDRLFDKEPKPVHKFKVGDRVKCIKVVDHNEAIVGKYGTVKYADSHICAVDFDTYVDGHNCGYDCKNGYGWYCPPEILELTDHREFKIGDRVKCTQAYSGNLRVKNARGTVKIVNDQQIGVEFDEDVGGHTLNKYAPQAKPGRGWYCSPEVLKHED